jgi:hypothetical protein
MLPCSAVSSPFAKKDVASSKVPIEISGPTIEKLKSVYEFKAPAEEFVQVHAGEPYTARHTAFQQFTTDSGYGEFELGRCQNWYRPLPFASLVNSPIDNKTTLYYRCVIINPSSPKIAFVANKKSKEFSEKFKKLLKAFYIDGFETNATTRKSIALAIEKQISFMVVVFKQQSSHGIITNLSKVPDEHIHIIAAVTFGRCF